MELLVVIVVTGVLLGILVPALANTKRSALSVISKNNKRQVTMGVLCYSGDNNDKFPDSVARLGTTKRWSWTEPTMLAGFQGKSPAKHRSMSGYLRDYIESSSSMFCPSSPSKYPFAQEAWQAGDSWDNPESNTAAEDPLYGNYCFYWNYVGYLAETGRPFVGPGSINTKGWQSKLMITDYFGYGHWRNELAYGDRKAYGSCEKLDRGDITPGTSVSCNFFSVLDANGEIKTESMNVKLNASYVDGHVETYTPADVMSLKISVKPNGTLPYPDNISPGGTFYIPKDNR